MQRLFDFVTEYFVMVWHGNGMYTEVKLTAFDAFQAATKVIDELKPKRLTHLTVRQTKPVNVGSNEVLEYRFERE